MLVCQWSVVSGQQYVCILILLLCGYYLTITSLSS